MTCLAQWCKASTYSSVGSVEDLRTGGHWFESPARPIFFESHCRKDWFLSHSNHCFYDGYVGKKAQDWKEHCAEFWLKELQESMDKCTSRR